MLRCFSSPAYVATLPAGHVFPMSKFSESAEALRQSGVARVIDPGVVCDRDLLRVHTPEYVNSIRTGRYNELTALRLGLPWHPTIAARSFAATAGTIAATGAAFDDGIAANLAGGTHHAFPDRGEGFCVFNDVAVAVRSLQHIEPTLQILIIDLDAHQGNATNFIFRDEPNVFSFSMHVGRNYPSRKEPGTLDVELPRWVDGATYLATLAGTLPDILARFEPDIVYYNAGVDVHVDDRFGQMRLSTDDMLQRDRMVMDRVRADGVPLVVVYGGGYNRTPGMTAALHVQTVRVAAEYAARHAMPTADITG
jgi:acetoin utilization deacetylase AcuC-like enzyme